MKKLTIALLAGITAVFALSVTAPAVAKKGKRHAVAGVVQSVGTNSLTLQVKKNKTVTVTVNDETKILVSGQAATLADIEVGYIALVRGQKNEAAKVVRAHPAPAAGTVVRGVVESTGSNSITVKTKTASLTIEVTAQTKIRVNGKAATLADVKAGQHVVVIRGSASGPATAIAAGKRPAAGARALLRGVVQSVGTDSITIQRRNGSSVTVSVTAATQIRVRGHAGAAALSDIQAGFRIAVLRAGKNGVALAILAAPPS